MLNLDPHMLVATLDGTLTGAEEEIARGHELAISGIVLWELAKLVRIGRLEMDLESRLFRRCLGFLTIIPITPEIAVRSTRLDFRSDPADELIAATSIVERLPLLTRDERILSSHEVPLAVG